ncbi:ExbD/TolR family protein [Tsuneonella amylolytica]|uniref:ExbD/TolR family protein n=1 Tax=Tsuneonella amylolytica TaxID=2338327 RepID=UPI0013C46ADF|nr:biopolymer transporter ExbD [Tsuneonella amylolytica]
MAPLAGVLLTMTLVFAALRPPVSHALLVNLPIPVPPDHIGVLSPAYNRLAIDRDGTVRWNGETVDRIELRAILLQTHSQNPQPTLLFDPSPDVAYASALAILGIVREAGLIDRCFRFADTGRYRRFEAPPDIREFRFPSPRTCDVVAY